MIVAFIKPQKPNKHTEVVLHTAELLAKGRMKAKHFHGSRKTEQLRGKVSSSSHFSVNSIKSSPPLKPSVLKYDNVKAFYNPQRRKYSLCEHTELESVFSVSKAALLPKRQSLDKPNSMQWGKTKRTHSSHVARSFRGISPQIGNQACQDALK